MNNNSVNPAGIDFSAEHNDCDERVNNPREPPPPYSPRDVPTEIQPPTIVHQTIIVQAPLKKSPQFYMCPQCRKRVLTNVKYVSSKSTHMLAGFICGMTLWCMLCCFAALPYYCHTFEEVQHYCPICDELLGTSS